ncbi:MAG: fibronectin type III domain-containing protein [Usitatibacteraceae bacterium]
MNPTNIQIDGLTIRGAHPNYQFTDTNGVVLAYTDFGACIWVEQGQGVVIADNEITDCSQGIFTKSIDNGDSAITKNIRIAGNYFHNNGISGQFLKHDTYTESAGIVYEFNRFATQKVGAAGNAIKDRSAGTVIRYNRIEVGAHALDLVEADASGPIAVLDPAYRKTFVYGNQIIHNGNDGTAVHYGGDLSGGESQWRKGVLYFFNNSVRITGTGAAQLFQLSTTQETAYVWNNVFLFDSTVQYASMRANQDATPPYVSGGILNLGKNWIVSNWADSDPFHPVSGQLNGSANMITGTVFPVDPDTFIPIQNSVIIDAGTAPPAAAAADVAAHIVDRQLDLVFMPKIRSVLGNAVDLGAIETISLPSTPTNVIATAGNGQATISFSPPANDGGDPVANYTVTCNPGTITTTGSSPVIVQGLVNAMAYNCNVTARNSVGVGPASTTRDGVCNRRRVGSDRQCHAPSFRQHGYCDPRWRTRQQARDSFTCKRQRCGVERNRVFGVLDWGRQQYATSELK